MRRAFAAGGLEVRIVHPFATKQYRQPSDAGNKTDDTDLAAIHRCAVNGLALVEPSLDEPWRELQLLIRHRRDLVGKVSALCRQIREHLEAAMPGYAACFKNLWQSKTALPLAWELGSAEAIRQAGLEGLGRLLRESRIRFQQRTLQQALERQIASRLAQTSYVFLLSIPGINVVSAGDFAGEMGPIHHYANSRCITGRAATSRIS